MKENHVCCSHVYTGKRDVLLVIRTENYFEFSCGKNHAETHIFEYIDIEHILSNDDSLSNIKELKINHRLERKNKNSDWIIKYNPCVDLNYIKDLNSSYISDLYGFKVDYLPILDVDTCIIRNIYQVKVRVFLLAVLVQVSFEKVPVKETEEYLQFHNLYSFLTEEEKNLFKNKSKDQLINMTWRSECLYILLWCLGLDIEIADARALADLDDIPIDIYPFIDLKTDPNIFINNSELSLRSNFSIISVLDYFSRLDYICDLHTINKREIKINTALVFERRYALLWLYDSNDWDDIICNSILKK